MTKHEDKFLKVMADYSSTGLWRRDGVNVEPDDYDLSPATLKLLSDWCHLYEQNDDYKPEADRLEPRFDLKAFVAQGLEVAKAVKKELPDFEVIYFDETYETRNYHITITGEEA